MNVFSAFNGIGCAAYVLQKLGYKVDKYYAAEIDPRANFVASKNYPKTIHYGDITKIKTSHFLSPINFMCGGSPCQDLSIAGKMAGLNGLRSRLFFEFVRLKNEFEKMAEDAGEEFYFFFENVRMTKINQDKISELLGCEPIYFDSELVSAQTRKRLYWTNIISAADFVYPENRGIVLNDILQYGESYDKKSLSITATYHFAVEKDYLIKRQRQMIKQEGVLHQGGNYKNTDKANSIDANYFKGLGCNQTRTGVRQINPSKESGGVQPYEQNRIYDVDGKGAAITANKAHVYKVAKVTGNVNPSNNGQNGNVYNTNFKAPTLTTNKGEGIKIEIADTYRKLTPIEVERCFSLPDNYTKGISNSARYHGLGNGWEAATIEEFFKHLPKNL